MFLVQGIRLPPLLLAAISGKLSLADALELSNKAAGIVVSKVGTYPVHKEELLREILADSQPESFDYRPMTWGRNGSIDKDLAAGGRDCCLYQWLLSIFFMPAMCSICSRLPNWEII